MKKGVNYYKILSIGISLLYLSLFAQLFIDGNTFASDLGLETNESIPILCRRMAVFLLGLSILMFSSRNLTHSSARQYLCLATGITMMLMPFLGGYELIRGTVNSSMLFATAPISRPPALPPWA